MPRAQIGQESMSRLGPFGPSSPHLRNLMAGIANCIFLIYGQQWAPAASTRTAQAVTPCFWCPTAGRCAMTTQALRSCEALAASGACEGLAAFVALTCQCGLQHSLRDLLPVQRPRLPVEMQYTRLPHSPPDCIKHVDMRYAHIQYQQYT